jgi:uncharacterized protein
MDFDSFTVVVLVLADDPPALPEAQAAALQDAHLAHLARLHDDGVLLAAGPTDDPAYRGVCLFRGGADAATYAAQDPAVRAGRLRPVVLPWQVPAGALHATPTRFPRSVAEVGG